MDTDITTIKKQIFIKNIFFSFLPPLVFILLFHVQYIKSYDSSITPINSKILFKSLVSVYFKVIV